MKRLASTLLLLVYCAISALAADLPSIGDKTRGMEKHEGYFTYYWDDANGKIWLEIDRMDQPFLYVNSLAAGVGSNDIGLDRGQLGSSRVVKFERRGPKIFLLQPNLMYRADTPNKLEQQSVHQAFAKSILWGFKVEAADGGKVLVDATDFLLRDAHDVIGRLRSTDQGSYRLDDSRSAVYLPRTKAFPKNTEFEATLTFTGDHPGRYLRSVVPTPQAITVRQHHSFIQLPDDGYRPRQYDPRAGYFSMSYDDYSTPVSESTTKRFITRHRLQKKNPDAAVSEPVKPIIYYLDPGTPEPVRSALMEGASWWNQAFEAIGYKNAFQVKMLPADADPMDVRYNVIQWVHRSTRGWSYGASVVDPRTGEIIKGHVSLGSLRVRQDYLIAEGLLAPYKNGIPQDNPMLKMALARIRQLAAHEVGHTLGLAHNFAASYNDRSSVMDYPAPMIGFKADGSFDLSKAYDTDIGEWDKVSIAYGYSDVPEGKKGEEELNGILDKAEQQGLLFISDKDARPAGGAHPYAHLWDNGTKDPVGQMDHILKVRKQALEQFSKANIKPGEPTALLEDVLVPMYLYHRYQLEATVKLVGGMDYSYKLRGDRQQDPAILPADMQNAAIDAMLKTIDPQTLMLPGQVAGLISPRPIGYSPTRELFHSHTDPIFDPLGIAETAADMSVSLLLNPKRAARLVDFHARNADNPGLGELVDRLLDHSWKASGGKGYAEAVQLTVDHVVLYNLLQLAADREASSQVRAVASYKVQQLKQWMQQQIDREQDDSRRAALYFGVKTIEDYEDNPEAFKPSKPLQAPPGSPIGSGAVSEAPLLECSF